MSHTPQSNRAIARVLLVLLLAITATATLPGCYGSFALTEKLHKWNGQVTGNKHLNAIIFWGLIIIPVYEGAVAADALICNTLEHWLGDNPVASNMPDTTQAQMLADNSYEIKHNGKTYRVIPVSEHEVALHIDGTQVATANMTATGGLAFAHTLQGFSRYFNPEDVQKVRQQLIHTTAFQPE